MTNELHRASEVDRFITDHGLANLRFHYQMMLDADVMYQRNDDGWDVYASGSLFRYVRGVPQLILMLAGILGRERPWFDAPSSDELREFVRAFFQDAKAAEFFSHEFIRCAGSLRQAIEMEYLLAHEYVSLEQARELARYQATSDFLSSHVEFLTMMAALRVRGADVRLLEGSLVDRKLYRYLEALDLIEGVVRASAFSCSDVGAVFDFVFRSGEQSRPPGELEAIVRSVLGNPERSELHYDIAISYSTDDSAFVEPIAKLLREQGVAVFFDRYEQANLWGKDLYSHLSDVYARRARYCLMVISSSYALKQWTSHERRSAQSRALSEHQEYILPLRLDDVEVPGLLKTIAYIDGRKTSGEELVDLLLAKLGRKRRPKVGAT